MDIQDNLAEEAVYVVSVAHSPDNDDLLMFMPIKEQLIDTAGLQFEFIALDTATLNQAAMKEEFDVVAVSAAALSEISDNYYVLSSGASVGRNFGPVIIAPTNKELSEIKTVAVPGLNTTAAALTRQILPRALQVVIEIEPFERVFKELEHQKVDAAVIIHEGQLLYKKFGMHLILDVGKWWFENYELPIPLGVNVLSKDFNRSEAEKISTVLKRSIEYAINNFSSLEEEMQEARSVLNKEELKEYIARYVNEDTLELKDDCKQALRILTGVVDLDYI